MDSNLKSQYHFIEDRQSIIINIYPLSSNQNFPQWIVDIYDQDPQTQLEFLDSNGKDRALNDVPYGIEPFNPNSSWGKTKGCEYISTNQSILGRLVPSKKVEGSMSRENTDKVTIDREAKTIEVKGYKYFDLKVTLSDINVSNYFDVFDIEIDLKH